MRSLLRICASHPIAALAPASTEGLWIAAVFIELIRPYTDPKLLAEELIRVGKEVGELMKKP